MSEEHTEATQAMEAPTVEQLEAELKKEQYRHNYGRVLRSTAFSLLVVAAVAVLVAVLLLPVLQINGTSMTFVPSATPNSRPGTSSLSTIIITSW